MTSLSRLTARVPAHCSREATPHAGFLATLGHSECLGLRSGKQLIMQLSKTCLNAGNFYFNPDYCSCIPIHRV